MAAKEAFHLLPQLVMLLFCRAYNFRFGALMALLQNMPWGFVVRSINSQMGYIIVAIGSQHISSAKKPWDLVGLSSMPLTTLYTKFLFPYLCYYFYHTGSIPSGPPGGSGAYFAAYGFFLLSFGAISWFALLNGYASKTLIHDALLEAHHYYHTFDIYLAERPLCSRQRLFLCYYATVLLPFRAAAERYNVNYHTVFNVSASSFTSAGIILLGIWPNIFIENYLLPAAQFQFIAVVSEHLTGFHFFSEAPLNA